MDLYKEAYTLMASLWILSRCYHAVCDGHFLTPFNTLRLTTLNITVFCDVIHHVCTLLHKILFITEFNCAYVLSEENIKW